MPGTSPTPAALESHLAESEYGLSARRLWEHSELGQIDVFAQAISARRELNDPAASIDLVSFASDPFVLAGFTRAAHVSGEAGADRAGPVSHPDGKP